MDRLMFKFYKSYYDVAQELSDKDRLLFYEALFKKQFYGIDPELKGLANFAYISQKHSIDKQVKGWEDKMSITLLNPTQDPSAPPTQDPSIQLEEEEEVKEKVKEKEYRKFKHLCISFDEVEKLKENYTISQIDGVLDSIENYRLNKNYVSLYLTAKKWLEKEYPNAKNNPHPNGIGKTNQKLMTYDD